jgi:hypothetical protein
MKGIQISTNKCVNTFLFPDGQVVVSSSEDDLEISAHELKRINMQVWDDISTEK